MYLTILLFCTLGLGGWWAIQELNWGGWWNWDLIEMFLFYFLMYLLLIVHSAKNLVSLAYSMLYVILSLFFFFILTRQGIITSIHAFTAELANNYFFTCFLLCGCFTIIYFKYFKQCILHEKSKNKFKYINIFGKMILIFLQIFNYFIFFILIFSLVNKLNTADGKLFKFISSGLLIILFCNSLNIILPRNNFIYLCPNYLTIFELLFFFILNHIIYNFRSISLSILHMFLLLFVYFFICKFNLLTVLVNNFSNNFIFNYLSIKTENYLKIVYMNYFDVLSNFVTTLNYINVNFLFNSNIQSYGELLNFNIFLIFFKVTTICSSLFLYITTELFFIYICFFSFIILFIIHFFKKFNYAIKF